MRIFKPQTLGLLHKPYRHLGKDRLVIAALGFFRLGEPVPRFLTEPPQWPAVLKAMPQGEPVDAVMPKPQGEYLIATHAFAPQGEALTEMRVSASVAGREKRLQVIGDRQWRYGLLPWHQVDEPQPFRVMPIDYRRAYGGSGHPGNSLGVGYTGSRYGAIAGVNEGAMPNILPDGESPTDHHRQHPPAGFLPLDIRWQPRAGLLGNYDADWFERRFPGLADDLQWSAFNTAPLDQRIDGPWQGDEAYRLTGMHPTRESLEGRLPAMRVTALVQREGQAVADSEGVELHCDTVWFYPEFELGLAIYRGQCDIADSEAEDIDALLLGYTHAEDAPRPIDDYRTALALRLNPDTAPAHALNDAPLSPLRSAEEQHQLTQEQAGLESVVLARQQARLDEMSADFWADSALPKPADYCPPQAVLPALGVPPLAAMARGELDLTELTAKAKALGDMAKRHRKAALNELQQQQAADPLLAGGQAALSDKDLHAQLQEAEARAAKPASDLDPAAVHDDAAELDSLLAQARVAGIELDPRQQAEVADSLAKRSALQRQSRRLSPEPPASAPSAAVAMHLGRRIRQWLAEGQCLAGRDLRGADLAGIDLGGVDLREVLLEQADLRGASLTGAQLGGAVLTAARLEGVDFSNADLAEANLSQAQAVGAVFRQACLDKALIIHADFSKTDLSGASLRGLVTQQLDLSGADLTAVILDQALFTDLHAPGSSWPRARLTMVSLNGAVLTEADLTDVHLEACVLLKLQAEQSNWGNARLTRVFAGGARLQQADLRGLRAGHSSWRDADLSGADLRRAALIDCDLGKAKLVGSDLSDAVLSRSILIRTDLRHCIAHGLQAFQSLLRKADLRHADLRDANLTQANLFEARLDHAELAGVQPWPLGRAA